MLYFIDVINFMHSLFHSNSFVSWISYQINNHDWENNTLNTLILPGDITGKIYMRITVHLFAIPVTTFHIHMWDS